MTQKWPEVALGDVVTIERSVRAPDDIEAGCRYVGLEDIESGGREITSHEVEAGQLASAKFEFNERHILYGKLRPYLAKIALPEFHGVCSTDILPVLPGPKIDRTYLCQFLRQPSMVDFAASRSSGVNLPRLAPAELARFRVPLPSIEEQRRVAAVLDQADAVRTKRRRALDLLDTLNGSVFLDMFGEHGSDGSSWETRPLSDATDLIQIGPFGSLLHQTDYVQGGVPLVNPMHIVDGQIVVDPRHTVGNGKAATLGRYRMSEGDIVMGRRGEMGRCAVVRREDAGLICGSGSLFLRPAPDVTTSPYLQALLSSDQVKRALERKSLGITMPNLNSAMVETLEVPVPPVDLQRRFADRVAEVEEERRRLERSADRLDELFASLQHRAFRGEL